MSEIIYRVGDLFHDVDFETPTIKLIPHCCNNVDAYGAGFAGAVGRHYPIAKSRYHDWYRLGIDFQSGKSFRLGQYQSVRVTGNDLYCQTFILNMIGQQGVRRHDNPKPVKYDALAQCITDIGSMLKRYSEQHESVHPVEIITVKFGSDLAGGDWNIIEEMVRDHWLMDNVQITVFSLG